MFYPYFDYLYSFKLFFNAKEVFTMLTYHNTGIQKYILDRICEIDDEIVNEDPEYRELLERVDEWKKQLAPKLPLRRINYWKTTKGAGWPRYTARKRSSTARD
jgi:hypothetical protein